VDKGKCHDFKQEYVLCSDLTGCGNGISAKSWEYQACIEVPLPANSNGKRDMFFEKKWSIVEIGDWCAKNFKVRPAPEKFSLSHGGLDLARVTSNVILTNGDLDPWMPGGFDKDLSPTIKTFLVEGGAHHLDLRGDNKEDPKSVIEIRNEIEKIISGWIHEDYEYYPEMYE